MPRRSGKTPWQIFAMPILLAIVSIIGLVSALTGDGWRDAIAWAGLFIPVAAAAWAWRRKS